MKKKKNKKKKKKKKNKKKKKKKKKKKILLFTNYGPTRGMNIHIYNYLKHNICLAKTITYTYNMSFICSVWLICFNTSSYDICII
jgi:hypothetical protein